MEARYQSSYGIYIHIPFCLKKCRYCDFTSAAFEDKNISEYIYALIIEINLRKIQFKDCVFDTLFFGGGTPSCIKSEYFLELYNALSSSFNLNLSEFTIEINPATVDSKLLQTYNDCNINRISIGLQCANDRILKNIGRIHATDDFIKTYKMLIKNSFHNINVDIMSGLPEQTADDIIKSIDIASDLNANHISLYSLKLEEGTPLFYDVKNDIVSLPTQDDEYHMHHLAMDRLKNLDYKQYEISNHAKDNAICLHNMKYWQRKPYLGLGLSAASFFDDKRLVNTPDLSDYTTKLKAGKLPILSTEILSEKDKAFEMVMLGSRLTDGFGYNVFKAGFNIDFKIVFKDIIDKHISQGLLKPSDSHFILTDKGLDLQNTVLVEYLEEFDNQKIFNPS